MFKKGWDANQVEVCKENYPGEYFTDPVHLKAINEDFGHLTQGHAFGLFIPRNLNALQGFLTYANERYLPVTLRSQGLSQGGQSLAPHGSMVIDLHNLCRTVEWRGDELIVGNGVSWKAILEMSLAQKRLPLVFPYNTYLTLGGVLAVGGIGSSSFKKGIIGAHVLGLEVITATGALIFCSPTQHSDFFHAALSGLGLFCIIYRAYLATRPCKSKVVTIKYEYNDTRQWLLSQFRFRETYDYIESMIEATAQEHAFVIYASKEYEKPPKELKTQSMPIKTYLYRHDARLNCLKTSDAWSSLHPWYECYVEKKALTAHLSELIHLLHGDFGGLYHLFPIKPIKPRFFMLPEGKDILTFNILPAQIEHFDDLVRFKETINQINTRLQALKSKRYLSGWLAEINWTAHYGTDKETLQTLKAKLDPNNIFKSLSEPDFLN